MGSLIWFIIFILLSVLKIESSIKIKKDAYPRLNSIAGSIGTIIAELFFMYTSWYIINYIINNIC